MNTRSCPALRARLNGTLQIVLLILLVSPFGNVQAGPPDSVTIWTTYSQVDGTAIDLDGDGEGDFVYDAVGSVLVGWNSGYWLGEHRGVYEFDVKSAPKLQRGSRVLLYLSCLGHYLNGEAMSHHFSLYAGPGNGLLEAGDFQAGEFVTQFEACDDNDPLGWWHDRIDVTRVVRRLIHQGAQDVVFIVRSDPGESASSGGILYNSYEWSLIDGGIPATLEIEARQKKKEKAAADGRTD